MFQSYRKEHKEKMGQAAAELLYVLACYFLNTDSEHITRKELLGILEWKASKTDKAVKTLVNHGFVKCYNGLYKVTKPCKKVQCVVLPVFPGMAGVSGFSADKFRELRKGGTIGGVGITISLDVLNQLSSKPSKEKKENSEDKEKNPGVTTSGDTIMPKIPTLAEVEKLFYDCGYEKARGKEMFEYYENIREKEKGDDWRMWRDSHGNWIGDWEKKAKYTWMTKAHKRKAAQQPVNPRWKK